MLSALIEEVSDTCGSHTDEHLDEIRTAGMEERDSGLACNCLGNQGLTCSRRSYQKDALGNLGSDFGVFLRILEELDDFLKLILGLFLACHVLERGLDVLVGILLCVALSELHHLSAARSLAQEHDGESDEDDPGQELQDDGEDGDISLGTYDLDVVVLEKSEKTVVLIRDSGLVLGSVIGGEDYRGAVLDVGTIDLAVLHGVLECGIGYFRRAVVGREDCQGKEDDQCCEDDQTDPVLA